MGEISIDPKFNIHETYKKVRILNPYRNSGAPSGGIAPTNGLVSAYNLDETSGTTIYDSFGSDHLTATNLAIGLEGKIGTSVSAIDDTGGASTTTATPITGNFTISAWVYPTDASITNSGIFDVGQFSSNGFGVWVFSDGRISFRINGSYNNYGTIAMPLNQWSHICMIYNGESVKVYIDNVLDKSTPFSQNPNTSTNRIIGRRAGYKQFVGRVDLAYLYNVAITDEERDQLFNNGDGASI